MNSKGDFCAGGAWRFLSPPPPQKMRPISRWSVYSLVLTLELSAADIIPGPAPQFQNPGVERDILSELGAGVKLLAEEPLTREAAQPVPLHSLRTRSPAPADILDLLDPTASRDSVQETGAGGDKRRRRHLQAGIDDGTGPPGNGAGDLQPSPGPGQEEGEDGPDECDACCPVGTCDSPDDADKAECADCSRCQSETDPSARQEIAATCAAGGGSEEGEGEEVDPDAKRCAGCCPQGVCKIDGIYDYTNYPDDCKDCEACVERGIACPDKGPQPEGFTAPKVTGVHFPASNPSKAIIITFDAPTNQGGIDCGATCFCSVILDDATVQALQASPARRPSACACHTAA